VKVFIRNSHTCLLVIGQYTTDLDSGEARGGVRGVETTLTPILARMATDLTREVTWKEVMA
jgi:hypothetical protein